jgi:hypothetical protein
MGQCNARTQIYSPSGTQFNSSSIGSTINSRVELSLVFATRKDSMESYTGYSSHFSLELKYLIKKKKKKSLA